MTAAPPPDISKEEFIEQQSQWLSNAMKLKPEILEMRERALPIWGGYSFSNIFHSQTVSSQASVNRHALLELIYQHFQAIGFHSTADLLVKESGYQFQESDQPWDRTDLHLLASLAVEHRENPWEIGNENNHIYFSELIEEDSFASPYCEDTTYSSDVFLDRNKEAVYSSADVKNYSTLRAASLKRLIYYLCYSPKNAGDIINDEERQLFFLSLHSITSSDHFLHHLVKLYDANGFNTDAAEIKKIRSGIIDTIRKWVEFHGLFIGRNSIKNIESFIKRIYTKDLERFLKPLLEKLPKLQYRMNLADPSKKPDPPSISNPQIMFNPNLNILMPDSLEVARQVSYYYSHDVFSKVHSLEFIIAFSETQCTIQTPTLNQLFAFEERLQNLFLDAFIRDDSPKEAYIKMLDVAEKLYQLSNFGGAYSVLELLKRKDVYTLGEATQPQMNRINELWDLCGNDGSQMPGRRGESNEMSKYEKTLIELFQQWKEGVMPNMHAELHSISESVLKMPNYIDGLVNWEKRKIIASRAALMYRFQNQCYIVHPISQIQKVIKSQPELSSAEIMAKISDRVVEITN